MLKRLLIHLSAYTLGNLLVTVAGFVSFPIFSRIFSVPEYGILNLISLTLNLLTALGKLGVQHASVRFYGEVKAREDDVELKQFYSTVLFGMAGTSLAIAILWAGTSQIIPERWWQHEGVRDLLLLTAVLVFIRVTDSGMVNILRAQQHSAVLNVYTVIKRYVELGIVLLMVLRIMPGLKGFYWGTILVEAVAVVLLFVWWRRSRPVAPSAFSSRLYLAMLAFGLPMVASEMGAILLSVGDRYVLQLMLGGEALGLYAAPYNLCEYVRTIAIMSLAQAMVPIYVRIWEEQGEAETLKFLEQTLHFYLLVGAAVVGGLAAVGEDLLVVLASDKYRAGAEIIPYVAAGMVIEGIWPLVGAGLNIRKHTRVVAKIVAGCVVLNLALNVALIPSLELRGAAIGTLVCYAVLTISIYVVARRALPIKLPWGILLKFVSLAFIMYLAVGFIETSNVITNLVAKVFLGIALYAALVVMFDRGARALALSRWAAIRARGG